MKCSLLRMYEYLQAFSPLATSATDLNQTIDINFVEEIKPHTEFDINTAYIGKFDSLSSDVPSNCLLLLIADAYPNSNLPSQGNMVLLFPLNTDLSRLFYAVKRFLTASPDIDAWSTQLTQIFMSSNSLDEFIESASAIIGSSVIIGNGGNIIASAWGKEEQIPVSFQSELMSYEFLASLYNSPQVLRNVSNRFPYLVEIENLQIRVCAVNLFYRNRQVGYVFFFGSSSISIPNWMNLCNQVACLIAKYITIDYKIITSKSTPWGIAFLDLLSGIINSKEDLNSRFNVGRFSEKRYFLIGVVKIDMWENAVNQGEGSLVHACQKAFHYIHSAYFEGNVVFLFGVDEINFHPFDRWQEAHFFFQEHKLIMALSDPFENILDTRKHYCHALCALKYAKLQEERKRTLVLYNNFKFMDLMPMLYADALNGNLSSDILDYRVLTMYRHDENHNTEYVKTVSMYLKCNRKITVAATELHIHKNTLAYRLEKVEELFGIRFENAEGNFWMLASLKFIEYCNLLPENPASKILHQQ